MKDTIIEKWAVCRDKISGDYFIIPEAVANAYSLWDTIQVFDSVFLAFSARNAIKERGENI